MMVGDLRRSLGGSWVEAVAALAPLDADVEALHVDTVQGVLGVLGTLLRLVLDEGVATLQDVKDTGYCTEYDENQAGRFTPEEEITYVALNVASAEAAEVFFQLKRFHVLGNVSYEQTHFVSLCIV